MLELELNSILEDLTDEEFKKFKWFLKLERVGDIEPIKNYQLVKAEREETVDLICHKYKHSGALEVMKSVLLKISRNDLLTKLSNKMGPADTTLCGQSQQSETEKKLLLIRSRFIDKVSEPVLRKLQDKLLEEGVIGDHEMEAFSDQRNRAAKAGDVIDTVRKKGPGACSVLIACLCEEDKFLSKELELM